MPNNPQHLDNTATRQGSVCVRVCVYVSISYCDWFATPTAYASTAHSAPPVRNCRSVARIASWV